MKPSVLFVIGGDPRTSPSPAEAIRIAAGIGSWNKVDVTLFLRDAAVLALSQDSEQFIDEDNYDRYLPIVGDWQRPVYVEQGSPFLEQVREPSVGYQELTTVQLAAVAAQSRYVMRF